MSESAKVIPLPSKQQPVKDLYEVGRFRRSATSRKKMYAW